MNNKGTHTVVSVDLTEADYRYIQQLSYKAKSTGGKKLPSSLILRSLVRFLGEMRVTPTEGIKTEEQLLECLKENAKKFRK